MTRSCARSLAASLARATAQCVIAFGAVRARSSARSGLCLHVFYYDDYEDKEKEEERSFLFVGSVGVRNWLG